VTGCERFRHDLGADVLDGLQPDEADRLADHLIRCGACRAERAELAATVELLQLTEDRPPAAPPRLGARVVAEAERRRGRRRWVPGLVAATLVGLVVGGALGWQLAAPPEPSVAVPLEAGSETTEVAGLVVFTPTDERLRVELRLDGLPALEEPGVYEAWLYGEDGRIVSIGQLTTVDGEVAAELQARGSLADFRTFWVTAEPDRRDPAHEGPTVARASVPQLP
jgi:hypothetical protein